MKRLVIALVLTSCTLAAASAAAGPVAPTSNNALRTMGIAVPIPPEWAGVWAVEDSTYNCLGALTGTSSTEDTVCVGQGAYEPPPGTPVTFTCDGTATATEVHMICTGSAEIMPDCQMNMEIRIDAILTSDAYFSVTTITTSYAGTATGCDLIPGNCTQINSHGTRTGPAPTDYCATPVQPSSWGAIKAHYR
jgi:hypothetical protein